MQEATGKLKSTKAQDVAAHLGKYVTYLRADKDGVVTAGTGIKQVRRGNHSSLEMAIEAANMCMQGVETNDLVLVLWVKLRVYLETIVSSYFYNHFSILFLSSSIID
jgi:hypothetical protein